MMISFGGDATGIRRRGRRLAAGIGLALLAATASGFASKPWSRPLVVRQVIVRREPIVIQAVTLAQLRSELRRARTAQVGYERQVAQQYQTIRHLQAQLDRRLQDLREANSQRADQLNAQFEVILQAFGLVVFAIIGALLVALSRTQNREPAERGAAPGNRGAVDWDPLQRQLQDTKSTLATVESRLRRLEIGVSQELRG